MKTWQPRIFLIFFLSVAFVTVTFYNCRVYAASTLIDGSNFDVYFGHNRTLTFQTDYDIDFKAVSGNWNVTNTTLTVNLRSGSISFDPYENCTLDIETVADRVFEVRCQNASLTRTNNNYTVVITTGDTVLITWRFQPWSLIDNYFMLGVGLTGIGMLIAGPSWFATTFVKHGLDDETVEHLGYAMLLVVMGFGFVVIWLWA